MTLLKAYLRGETDPIMLAKAYYDDMIHKSVEFAERLVKETLTFDMEKDMKIWEQEIKDAQDEIKFWEGMYEELRVFGELKPLFGDLVSEVTAERETAEDIEQINWAEIPNYIKELKNHIKNVQANINDGHDEYRTVVKEISGLDTKDWDKGRKGGWSDEQEYIPKDPEIYIKIHNIGLSYIRDKIQTYKDRFEYLKELPKKKGGIPKIKPKALKELQAKIQAQIQEFESTPIQNRPAPKERKEIISAIEREIDKYSMDVWTWQHLETKIKTWSDREKTSVKKLERFKFMQRYVQDKEKIKSEMNKKGYELVSSPVIEVKDGVPELINPNYQFMKLIYNEEDVPQKKYFEYDVESKKLNPIEEKQVVFQQATPSRMKFSDEKWWKQLSRTSERAADSPRVASQRVFQNALKDFFEGFKGTRFDEPVTANKTESGIGDQKDGKEIKENDNTRLLNLQKLYSLFEEHVQQPANRNTSVNTIMAGLSAEIEYLEGVFQRKRDKEGQVPNKNTGKKILKVLRESLTAMYDSIRHYKGGDYPEKFITHLNKVKRTRLSLRELQIFATNQVTVKALVNSKDRETKDRANYLLDTFDEDWPDFKKVVKLLEKPIGKEDNKLIHVIADVWNEEGTYKAPTKTREGQSSLNRLLDEALGEFEKTLDEQENAVTQIADPKLEEKIEENLEWMATMLEDIEEVQGRENIDDETLDELLQWFANTVTEFRNRVWEVMRRLNPDDPDFKRIKEIKDKIIDEVKNMPPVAHLVEDLVKVRSSNPEYILNERLNKVEGMQNAIAMLRLGGRDELKYLLQEDGSLNEDLAKKWIETQLEDAKSNKGKSKRNRLINKILNPEIEITEKDVNYDLKQTVHRNREMSKEVDEEYDEADVGHRQTEEMMEGAEEIYDDLPDEPEPEEESEEQRRLDEDEDW